MSGRVLLVGAGPGDPDLLTVRALRELERAEVLLYDALIDPAILSLVPESCERIDVGKRGDGSKGIAQDQIADLLLEKARSGRRVVRLKGGDPFVFGRGGEEATRLREAGIPFEIVPGISSAIAVPAYAGIPVTDRRLSSSLAIVTGHRGAGEQGAKIDWEGLSRSAQTLVILMGTAWAEEIVARVLAGGRDPKTPAAAISRGSTPRQRVVVAKLDELPAQIRAAGIEAPAVIVIGDVVGCREQIAWFERLPLFGRRVLVARASGQGADLALELRRRAAEPVIVPLLELVPAADPAALAEALARASTYDWIVYTSANAVRFATPPAQSLGRARVACIGLATAREARSRGLRVDLVPDGESTPERLAEALDAAGGLAGRSVLLPRAELAREVLPRALASRGARVDAVHAYRNRAPVDAGERLAAELALGIDAVLLTSPSTVERLFALLAPAERARLAARAAFACIGPTTAEALARALGGAPARAWTAQLQNTTALVDALERGFAEDSHGLS
ncbi:MAG: uroporphyrinogen-III C-methyltransferase [Deltaproteobacteria bacterium]|nr:uroporphyrinogen-III C-methyltransferase [Deltaproteobacteria bacterium]